MVYSQFRSAISQRPVYEKLLPVEAAEPAGRRVNSAATEYLIEPSAAELIPVVLAQLSSRPQCFHALLEAEASEHGARMTAMDAATNNAIGHDLPG